jgi:hypothetical protein
MGRLAESPLVSRTREHREVFFKASTRLGYPKHVSLRLVQDSGLYRATEVIEEDE